MTMLCLALGGCEYDDAEVQDRLDDLEDRVEALEKAVNELNRNVSTLQSLVDGKLFISSVAENPGGGYTLSLVTADGEASQIVIKDGEAGAAPVVGVRLDSDGKYYWTIDGEFLLADGRKIPVTGSDGVTPVFKIEDGMWYVSYDGTATWQECGKATGSAGDAFFKSVTLSEDGRYAYLTLADGETVLTLELYRAFGIAFEVLSEVIPAGATAEIPFTLTGADERSVVEAIAKGDWQAEVVMDGTEGGRIVVTAPAESSTGRVIVLLSDGGSKTIMKTLTFVAGVMSVSTQSMEAPAQGGPVEFELETNLEYDVVILDGAAEWLSYAETRAMRQETLVLQARANDTYAERSAKVELVSRGTVVETLLVYQKSNADPDLFVVRVDVTADKMKNTLILPLAGTVAATVDWGDGKSDEVTTELPQHVYDQAGEYYVAVKGSVTRLSGRMIKTSQSAIVGVVQWGRLGLESLEEAFYNNKGLTQVALPAEGAFAKVTSTKDMFYNCTLLTAVPEGLLDQCTELTSAASMFYGCAALTSIPAGFFDNCTKIASLATLFSGCKKLEAIPAGLFDRLTEATNLSGLLTNCAALTSVPDGLFDRLTKVTTVAGLFNGCSSLHAVPEDLFRAQTEVTACGTLFKGCVSLESIPAGLLDPFTKTNTVSSMFSGCKALGNLPAGLFDRIGADEAGMGVDASYLFDGCAQMTEFPTLARCPKLRNVAALWKGCTSLKTLPADYFPADCAAAISTGNMFNGCTSLESLPAGLLKNMTGVTTTLAMFTNCKSLVTLPEGFFDAMTACTNIKETFKGCTSLASLPAGLFDRMTSITATAQAFYGCTGFTGESPYLAAEIDGRQVKVHLYDRPNHPELFVKVPTREVDYKETFKNCTQMSDYTWIPIAWGGVSDGTTDLPTLDVTHAAPAGMEYHAVDFTVKGTECKSGRYIVGTTELVDAALAEFDGDMERATNKYGIPFSAAQLEAAVSAEGLKLEFHDLAPGTEYTLLVRGSNIHGHAFERKAVTTAARPLGSADYERYVGTWTVTTTSSEVTKKAQTYTVSIEPYRTDGSYKVYDWGVTTMSSKEENTPFMMTYNADGTVGLGSYDALGMYGFTYYIYLRYRFFSAASSNHLIWVSKDALVSGSYDVAKNEISIECGTFVDNSGVTQQITGLDYVLYLNGKYYEAQNLIRPGYLVGEGDNVQVDYGVGPYTLTRAAAAEPQAVRQNREFRSLRPTSEQAPAAGRLGAGRLSMIQVR